MSNGTMESEKEKDYGYPVTHMIRVSFDYAGTISIQYPSGSPIK